VLDGRLRTSLDWVFGLTDLYGTPLLERAYVAYSFILAAMHVLDPVSALQSHFEITEETRPLSRPDQLVNLSQLADALENDERDGLYKAFVMASTEKTNVASQRVVRFEWLCRALTEPLTD
jgi:hypothetical protein